MNDWQEIEDLDAFERDQVGIALADLHEQVDAIEDPEMRRAAQVGFHKIASIACERIKGEVDRMRRDLATKH